jgi:hypothetical protein
VGRDNIARGGLRRLGWRAVYTQASILAFRTFIPEENFVGAGVGTGRNFSDMDLVSVSASIPATAGILVTPGTSSIQWQGQGRINDPYWCRVRTACSTTPPGSWERWSVPIALGWVSRAGSSDSTSPGPADITTSSTDGNQPGVTADRLVGTVRVVATWERRGRLR